MGVSLLRSAVCYSGVQRTLTAITIAKWGQGLRNVARELVYLPPVGLNSLSNVERTSAFFYVTHSWQYSDELKCFLLLNYTVAAIKITKVWSCSWTQKTFVLTQTDLLSAGLQQVAQMFNQLCKCWPVCWTIQPAVQHGLISVKKKVNSP